MPPLMIALALQAASADPYAASVRATAPLPDRPGATVDLLVDGDAATLRVREGGRDVFAQPVTTVETALSILADRRAEPLWPALLDWAGPGLEGLRDRRLAAARTASAAGGTMEANSTAASSARPRVRAAILLASTLAESGRLDEAIAGLDAERGRKPGRGDWARVEWAVMTTRLASLHRVRDGDQAALAELDRGKAVLGPADPYAVNFDVNRAAILAEAGRHGEALAALDLAEGAFDGSRDGSAFAGKEKVPGSDRQFAWIRVCALTGLGRRAEAAALLPALRPVVEPSDADFRVAGSGALRYRLFRCAADAPAAARELAAEVEHLPLGGRPFLDLQPELRRRSLFHLTVDPALMRRVAADPALARSLAGRFRALPAAFTPALNGWRGGPDVNPPPRSSPASRPTPR